MNRKTTLATTIAGAATLVAVAIGASNAASATETGQTTTHSVVTSVDAPKPSLSDEQIATMNAAKDATEAAAEAPKPSLSDEQIAAMNAAKDATEAAAK